MVTKAKKSAGRKKKVKVLSLKKETVKNLSDDEGKRVKGGTGYIVQHASLGLGLAVSRRYSQPEPPSG